MFQSLIEVNCSVSSDQSNLQSKHTSAHLIPEIDASTEKLQVNDGVCGLIKIV